MNEKMIKWIVIGIVILTTILVFKGEIGNLLNRTTELEISGDKLRVVTEKTPVGDTSVSVLQTEANKFINNPPSNVFVSKQYQFSISWPLNSKWIPLHTMNKSQLAEYGYNESSRMPAFSAIKPPTSMDPELYVVTVYALPNNAEHINTALEKYLNTLSIQPGVEIISYAIDKNTGGAVVVIKDGITGWYAVNRLILGKEYMYIIVTKPASDGEAYTQLRSEINMILNSFRILI